MSAHLAALPRARRGHAAFSAARHLVSRPSSPPRRRLRPHAITGRPHRRRRSGPPPRRPPRRSRSANLAGDDPPEVILAANVFALSGAVGRLPQEGMEGGLVVDDVVADLGPLDRVAHDHASLKHFGTYRDQNPSPNRRPGAPRSARPPLRAQFVGGYDDRANSRSSSRKMFSTSRKIPAASGIASSWPARRRRLKSTTV